MMIMTEKTCLKKDLFKTNYSKERPASRVEKSVSKRMGSNKDSGFHRSFIIASQAVRIREETADMVRRVQELGNALIRS